MTNHIDEQVVQTRRAYADGKCIVADDQFFAGKVQEIQDKYVIS